MPKALFHQLTEIGKRRASNPKQLIFADPTDFILEKRLPKYCNSLGIKRTPLTSPGFINTPAENQEYRSCKNRWFMVDFYKWQRQRLDILMDGHDPIGDRWCFDKANRKKGTQETAGLDLCRYPARDGLDRPGGKEVRPSLIFRIIVHSKNEPL